MTRHEKCQLAFFWLLAAVCLVLVALLCRSIIKDEERKDEQLELVRGIAADIHKLASGGDR